MSWYGSLISVGVGSILGYMYGLSFLLQKRRVFHFHQVSPTWGSVLVGGAFFLRFICLGLAFYYLLLYPAIDFILVLIAFMVIFWLTLLGLRGNSSEKHRNI